MAATVSKPLIDPSSAWQSNYNDHLSQLTDNGKNTANFITDHAFQAVYNPDHDSRKNALDAARDQLLMMRGAVGEENPAVKDLQALVDVAEYRYDLVEGAASGQTESALSRAFASLEPLDHDAATHIGDVTKPEYSARPATDDDLLRPASSDATTPQLPSSRNVYRDAF